MTAPVTANPTPPAHKDVIMTSTEPTGPLLWQRLVQWQPAEAALLAQHIRNLTDDWPLRVFGVGRPDAALLLPPGATGEQFPDRVPEIAPFDEIAALEDCPACEEAGVLCRWHEGFAAAHQAQTQAQLDAVKARPEITLREFLHWQADVAEAEDRGEEPPLLPTAAPPAVWSDGDPLMQAIAATVWERCARDDADMPQLTLDDPRTIAAAAAHAVRALQGDRAALRQRIAAALYERERPPRDPHWPDAYAADREVFEAMADAVLAVLPDPTELRRVADEQPTTTKTETPAAELLTLATVLEIPRPGTGIPLQLRRSHGHGDRWAICDRTGRRWHREYGWVHEPDGIRDEHLRDDTRYTLAEAVPLAQQLAAGVRQDGAQQ